MGTRGRGQNYENLAAQKRVAGARNQISGEGAVRTRLGLRASEEQWHEITCCCQDGEPSLGWCWKERKMEGARLTPPVAFLSCSLQAEADRGSPGLVWRGRVWLQSPAPASRSTAQSGDAATYTRHRDSHSPVVSPDIGTSALNETQGSRPENKSPFPLEGIYLPAWVRQAHPDPSACLEDMLNRRLGCHPLDTFQFVSVSFKYSSQFVGTYRKPHDCAYFSLSSSNFRNSSL